MNAMMLFEDQITQESESHLLEFIDKLSEPCFVTDQDHAVLSVNKHLHQKLGPNCLKAFLKRVVTQLHAPEPTKKKIETILIMKEQECGIFQISKIPLGDRYLWILKETSEQKSDDKFEYLSIGQLYYENIIRKILQNSNQLMVKFDTHGNCLGVTDPENNDHIAAEISDLEKIFDGHLKKENIPIWLFQLKASPLSEDELLALVPDELIIKGYRFKVNCYFCRKDEDRHQLVMLLKKN